MRITDTMTYNRTLSQLQDQFTALNQVSDQVTTGQRYSNISDDPVAGGQTMQIDASLRGITQYNRNITSVTAGLNGEESTLNQITDLIDRAKELATEQEGSNSDADSRTAAAAEVQELFNQAVSLGNLQVGDKYVFAGTATDAPPFQADGTYVGNTTTPQAEIGNGVMIDTTHTGAQLLVDSGVLSSISDLHTALTNNDPTAIGTSMTELDTAMDATQTNLSDVGARTNRLTAASTAFDTQSANLNTQLTNVASIPLDEASVKLATIQNALQAGLLATNRILTTSLVNYLQ